MGGRRQRSRKNMDGLISFFGSYHAMRAEAVLKRSGFAVQLIPGPKELSPNCGVALRFEFARRDSVLALLAEKNVRVDDVHVFRPRTDGWRDRGNPAPLAAWIRRWI